MKSLVAAVALHVQMSCYPPCCFISHSSFISYSSLCQNNVRMCSVKGDGGSVTCGVPGLLWSNGVVGVCVLWLIMHTVLTPPGLRAAVPRGNKSRRAEYFGGGSSCCVCQDGERIIGPSLSPPMPPFLPGSSHCHFRTGLCGQDHRALSPAFQRVCEHCPNQGF